MTTRPFLMTLLAFALSAFGCQQQDSASKTTSDTAPPEQAPTPEGTPKEPEAELANSPNSTADTVMKLWLHAVKTNNRELYMSCTEDLEHVRSMIEKHLPTILANSENPPPDDFDIDAFVQKKVDERVDEKRAYLERYARGFDNIIELSRHVAGFVDAEFVGSAVERVESSPFNSVGFRGYDGGYLYFKTSVNPDTQYRFRFSAVYKDPDNTWFVGRWRELQVKKGDEWVSAETEDVQ